MFISALYQSFFSFSPSTNSGHRSFLSFPCSKMKVEPVWKRLTFLPGNSHLALWALLVSSVQLCVQPVYLGLPQHQIMKEENALLATGNIFPTDKPDWNIVSLDSKLNNSESVLQLMCAVMVTFFFTSMVALLWRSTLRYDRLEVPKAQFLRVTQATELYQCWKRDFQVQTGLPNHTASKLLHS